MTLSIESLRETTAKVQKERNTASVLPTVILDTPEILGHIQLMELLCQEFAADGHFHCEYKFTNETDTAELVGNVAQAFKNKHYKFMLIAHLGARNITIDWSGKNEC